ncbi:MAG: DUF1795 domain-containing protein [Armatimonadetes bacterium]|nr:DUF1795 domain-containing protein [Armatimonadota bacterium]
MRHYLLAALLAVTVAAGCGGDATSMTHTPPDTSTLPVDIGIGRQFNVPSAPSGAGIETYSNAVFNFSLQFPADEFALFDPPQYVTTLGNRVFELVSRTLPEGEVFRPNVGMIVDSRFQGQTINIEGYADAAPPILSDFFVDFNLVARRSLTVSGHQAVILEHQSSWAAPDGTVVPFHRYTLYTENRGNILIFTFTTPTAVFETYRPVFDQIISTIALF